MRGTLTPGATPQAIFAALAASEQNLQDTPKPYVHKLRLREFAACQGAPLIILSRQKCGIFSTAMGDT